ncbi:hypothetical protein BV25DRAFT_1875774 [Artomyces pyxidatus]|uniref:Uncharacterized protein n=1 Tax=Artomyces pyxidatus TaxID=48021 RepID=A0ACB8TIU6_9AGAM|nr:hypothetical protein BV25DRAFT_1875774 [Artomyces pyxidatus]
MAQPQRPHRAIYPVPWLEQTFPTAAKAEELLRPDFEDGTITQHDYDSAKAFFSGHQKAYTVMYAMAGSVGAYAIGSTRKPPWSFRRVTTLAAFMSAAGVFYGVNKRVKAHIRFLDSLDDRTGFFRALENVNARTGGQQPLGLPTKSTGDSRSAQDGGVPADQVDQGWANTSAPAAASTPESVSGAPTTPESQPSSRWGDIRAENARKAGKSSAWDELRRNPNHARVSNEASVATGSDADSQQATFDAMLEAERRRAQGSEGSPSGWRS